MNAFRSVGARLSLALLVVVALALGVVYLIVVPSLEDRLVNAKLSQLERAAPSLGLQYVRNQYEAAADFFQNAAASTGARAVVFKAQLPTPLSVWGDSAGAGHSSDIESDRIALEAYTTNAPAHGTVTRADGRFAEAAVPLRPSPSGDVLLLSAPLEESLSTVHFIKQRLLVAGGVALLVALLVGYGGAWIFARRIRRLERAAEEIADGRFDEPVVDASSDELGELARAFERMRVRLAQLDHARREFVANASHELRTPLFSLGGSIELLTEEELDEETRRDFLLTMREQVERLARLAEELLDLSRLDAGRIHIEPEPLELVSLAEALVEEFGPVARAADHPLELLANGDVGALGDEQRVLQIGRILVENALVHTPSGTSVVVTVRREDGRAVLAVEDAGAGIPPEHQEQLFERFYRVDGTRASGSGLGLAIARELASLMGGRIELRSEPGTTVFRLLLQASVEIPQNALGRAIS